MATKHVLFFLCLTFCYICVNSDIICESGFCEKYRIDHACPTQAPDCRYNNATHSGIYLPSPTICNCCTHCLPLYGLGQRCSLGGAGSGITIGRCSHGLTCDNSTRTCIRMKTKCHDAQDDYDSRHSRGLTGTLESRPNCDNKGKYATFDCVPSQTCFCQSEDGERIFGEVPYTGIFQNMSCTCSRMAHKIQNLIAGDVPYPVLGLRCTSDGNFNPVQCLGKKCYCVNVITGEAHGDTTIDLDKHNISRLPCYNPDLDLFPQEDDAEPPYEYTTPCLNSVKEREDLIKKSIEEGYNVDYFTGFSSLSCLPDGTHSRMTTNSNGQKICINERGLPIGDFSAEPNTASYSNMNCKCAITSNLMNSSTESPQCCKNGNFRSIQCRRGQCYCVDSNGRQIGKENTDVTRLSCYNANWRNC